MTHVATATIKSTGFTYHVYPMPSRTSKNIYSVWTINGNPVHCTCKDRQYRPWKLCDHMTDWQAEERARYNANFDPCLVA